VSIFSKDPKLQEGDPPRPEEQATGVIISSDTRRENRIPSNQSRTKKWPVLDTGVHPALGEVTSDVWRFSLTGLVEEPVEWNWREFKKLPRTKVFAEINCKVSDPDPLFSVSVIEKAV
jgi:DMSO/TMAO reductase YedYZ molybdopterin-dependent catalytic subunit